VAASRCADSRAISSPSRSSAAKGCSRNEGDSGVLGNLDGLYLRQTGNAVSRDQSLKLGEVIQRYAFLETTHPDGPIRDLGIAPVDNVGQAMPHVLRIARDKHGMYGRFNRPHVWPTDLCFSHKVKIDRREGILVDGHAQFCHLLIVQWHSHPPIIRITLSILNSVIWWRSSVDHGRGARSRPVCA
jgi:hypothetical protein